jgi:hypothetical protein
LGVVVMLTIGATDPTLAGVAHSAAPAASSKSTLLPFRSGPGGPTGTGPVHTLFDAAARLSAADSEALSSRKAPSGPQYPTSAATPMSFPGHAHADVLVLNWASAVQRVEVLKGRSGEIVWSRRIPGAYAVEQALVRSPPRQTLIVYSATYDVTSSPDGSYTARETDLVQSLDATSGKTRWRWQSSGAETWAEGGPASRSLLSNVIEPSGLLHHQHGNDVLAVRISTSTTAAYVTPLVLSGQDGSVRLNGQPTAGQYGVTVSPAGDLSGDATDDFLVVAHNDSSDVSGSSETAAYSGADGALIWRHRYAVIDIDVTPGVRLTRDSKPDMVMQLERNSGDVVVAINGRNGGVLWRRPGKNAPPLHARDGRTDLVPVLTEEQDGNERLSIVTGTGRIRSSRSLDTHCRGADDLSSYPVADANGDGHQDIDFNRYCVRNGHDWSYSQLLFSDGTQGVREPYMDLVPPTSRLRPHLSALFDQKVEPSRLVLTARNGASGVVLWAAALRRSAVSDLAYGRFIRKSAQILVVTYAHATTVRVLEAATGKTVWKRTVSHVPS